MLTDQEMLLIAKRFLNSGSRQGTKNIEIIIFLDDIIKKPYGNIYYYDSKEYVETGDFNKSLVGNAPFLVEKKTGRVVNFGTSGLLENYLKAYENDKLVPSLTRYWYPDEDRFDYK